MDLLDAMCSFPAARSVVEYSLAACFARSYSTIFKGIDEMDLAPLLLPEELEAGLSALQASAVRNDRQGILRGLQNLVPEFEPMVEKAADKPVKVVESVQETPQDAGKDVVRASLL